MRGLSISLKNSSSSPQLEKANSQQWRPSAAKNWKEKNFCLRDSGMLVNVYQLAFKDKGKNQPDV